MEHCIPAEFNAFRRCIMSQKLLSFKNDYVFRKIFGGVESTEILADFLSSVLDLHEDEFERLTITDPIFKQDHKDDKFGVLDIKVYTKSGKVIDVEIQVAPQKFMKERIVYYTSRLLTEQMTSGDPYSKIEKAISIVITDFELIGDSPYYHNRYSLYDHHSNTYFGDVFEINTLELRKLPPLEDGSKLWDWLKLISTEEENVMEQLAAKNDNIRKTVGVLKEMSNDERERALAQARQKAIRDEQARLEYALDKKSEETARNFKALGVDIAIIAQGTGLSKEEIEKL
jgi:predicted transposase/invertase (TIGR01784 family)